MERSLVLQHRLLSTTKNKFQNIKNKLRGYVTKLRQMKSCLSGKNKGKNQKYKY